MKRTVSLALATVVCVAFSYATASAQATISVAGGMTFPTGAFNTGHKPGWLAHAGVDVPLGESMFAAGVDGFYGSNSWDPSGGKTNLYGGVAHLSVAPGSATGPQVFGLAGLMREQAKPDAGTSVSQSGFAAGGGVGMPFPLGSIGGMVEAYFISAFGNLSGTHFFGVDVGVGFPIGGSGM
jgi:hypothetical protein